jgi:hypothetical protein
MKEPWPEQRGPDVEFNDVLGDGEKHSNNFSSVMIRNIEGIVA